MIFNSNPNFIVMSVSMNAIIIIGFYATNIVWFVEKHIHYNSPIACINSFQMVMHFKANCIFCIITLKINSIYTLELCCYTMYNPLTL